MAYFKGRDEKYKLEGGITLVIDGTARDELIEMVAPYCQEAADNIRDAANATSSWGAYESYYQDGGATVSALNAEDGERARRLLAAAGIEGSTRIKYVTKSGKTRWATQAQVDNWTRGR